MVPIGTFPAPGYPRVSPGHLPFPSQERCFCQVTLLPPKSPAQGQCSLLRALPQAPGQAQVGRLRGAPSAKCIGPQGSQPAMAASKAGQNLSRYRCLEDLGKGPSSRSMGCSLERPIGAARGRAYGTASVQGSPSGLGQFTDVPHPALGVGRPGTALPVLHQLPSEPPPTPCPSAGVTECS